MYCKTVFTFQVSSKFSAVQMSGQAQIGSQKSFKTLNKSFVLLSWPYIKWNYMIAVDAEADSSLICTTMLFYQIEPSKKGPFQSGKMTVWYYLTYFLHVKVSWLIQVYLMRSFFFTKLPNTRFYYFQNFLTHWSYLTYLM